MNARITTVTALLLLASLAIRGQAEPQPVIPEVDSVVLNKAKGDAIKLWYCSPLCDQVESPRFLWSYWLKFNLPDTSRSTFTEANILADLRFYKRPVHAESVAKNRTCRKRLSLQNKSTETVSDSTIGINFVVVDSEHEIVASLPPFENRVFEHHHMDAFVGYEETVRACYANHKDLIVFWPNFGNGTIAARWMASIDRSGHLVWIDQRDGKRYSTDEIRECKWKEFLLSWAIEYED